MPAQWKPTCVTTACSRRWPVSHASASLSARFSGIAKYNPLFDWSEPEVWAYLEQHNVPTNALHDKGYPSIGCEPCTRAVRAGEDVRAGRWWWESRDSKECGLHATNLSQKS